MAVNEQGLSRRTVNGTLVPLGSSPIALAGHIQGGLRTVADQTERLALTGQHAQDGMLIYQSDTSTYYKFNIGSLTRDSVSGAFNRALAAGDFEEIQFDVDSITVSSGNNDPLPRQGGTTGTTPSNPHEGDLYINSVTNALWYYVGGTTNMWVNSQGITEATGDARYVRYDAAQTLNTTQQGQARDNIGAGDIDAADVAITLNAANEPVVNSDTTAAAIRGVLDVHDTGNVAVVPFEHSTSYTANDLVAFEGDIYRRVITGTSSSTATPPNDRSNWVIENSLAAMLRFDLEDFDNVTITSIVANTNTFTFTSTTNQLAVALRERILREHFGFGANQGTISGATPLAIPAQRVTITASPASISVGPSQTVESTVPTGLTFSIRINGLTDSPLAETRDNPVTLTIQRNAERDVFNLFSTETIDPRNIGPGINQRINISGTDRELLLGVDETVARTVDLAQFQTGDATSTIQNIGTTAHQPIFQVRPDSIGQTQFDKETRAAVGALMSVGRDGQEVTYVPGNTNRTAQLSLLNPDFDLAVQRHYTRDNWNANHSVEGTNISARSTHNTTDFPLVSTDQGSASTSLSTHMSTQMIAELNALTSRSGVALEYAENDVYGIRPFHDTSTAPTNRRTIWQKTFSNPATTGPFNVSSSFGFQLGAYRDRTSGVFTTFGTPDLNFGAAERVLSFTEWVMRIDDIIQQQTVNILSDQVTNPFFGQYRFSVTNVTDRQATVVLTSTYEGAITEDPQASGRLFPDLSVIQSIPNALTSYPREVDGQFREVQSGVRPGTGQVTTPNVWTSYTEHTEEFTTTDATTSTFRVQNPIVNRSFVIVFVDGVRQTADVDYIVNTTLNTVTFRREDPPGSGNFFDRNLANGVTVRIIYSTAIDLSDGQYLLFQVTGTSGSTTGDITSARWLNDGIRTGDYARGETAFELIEYTTASLTETNRVNSNTYHVNNEDTGIRRLFMRTNIDATDIRAFQEAEHDRYILLDGNHYNPADPVPDISGVYLHILNIDEDNGTFIEVDMDHWISVTVDGTIVYRPTGTTFNREIVDDYDLFRLNFLGAGDVTKDGTDTQVVVRPTNFTNIQIEGVDQTSINANINTSNRVESFAINDGGQPSGTTVDHPLEAYTRSETDDRIERVISRVHTSGTTHNVALNLRATPNDGYSAEPTPSTHPFVLGAQPGMDGISDTDRAVLRSTQESTATQPFVSYDVPNFQHIGSEVRVGTRHTGIVQIDDPDNPGDLIDAPDGTVNSVDGVNRVFTIDQSIANVISYDSVLINNAVVSPSTYTASIGNQAQITFTTAPAEGTTIDIRYFTDRNYNDGIVSDSDSIRIAANGFRDGLNADETIVVLEANIPSTLVAGATVLINTGNEFNRVTSLVLNVRTVGGTLSTREFAVRRLTTEEQERYLQDPLVVGSQNGTVQVRTFEFDTLPGASLGDAFWSIPRINFRTTTTEDDPNIVGTNVMPSGRTYMIEITQGGTLYQGVGGIVPGGSGVLIFPNTVAWSPSAPRAASTWTNEERSQRLYFYETSTSYNARRATENRIPVNLNLYYHLAPTTSTVNTDTNWTAGQYTADLTTLYSASNEVLGDSALPLARYIFPVQDTFEIGYFSNRISLQGLERFEPIRDADTGLYTLNFTNSVANSDPTIFWRGFYRSDLTIPVFMIRQVDTSGVNIVTTWGGWDGNIDSIGTLTQSTVLPSGDQSRASQFILLTEDYAEGAATFRAGLYHRNTQDDGWRQITFGNTLPAVTTSNN